MAAGDEPDEQPLDHVALADHHLAGLGHELIDEGALALDAVVELADVGGELLHSGEPPVRSSGG